MERETIYAHFVNRILCDKSNTVDFASCIRPRRLIRGVTRPAPKSNKPLARHLVATPHSQLPTLSSINSMSFTLTRILFIYEM